jgi:hypothetical protein
LHWALLGSGLIEKGRSLANARRAVPLPTPPSFRDAVGEAARSFPGQGVASEIAQAVIQSLGPGLNPRSSLAALGEIERKGRGELLRLEALSSAARDEAGAIALAKELRAAGLDAQAPETVVNRSGVPFAWKLAGSA